MNLSPRMLVGDLAVQGLGGVQEWAPKNRVCTHAYALIDNVRANKIIVSKKPPVVAQPSPVPPPIFYDKPENKIGTLEVRMLNVHAVNNPSPTTYREQQNCEICHKKNHGEEMLLCDGCDCGEFFDLIRLTNKT